MFRKATAALGCAAMLALLCVTDQAVAQPQPAQDGDEAEVEAASDDEGYMKRYPPQAGTLELGVYFGAVFPSSNHSFSSTERDETELQDINNGLDVGLRLALYPLEFLGVEGELGYAPLSTEDDESAAWIMYRAHVLGQLPGSSITPFFVLGTGFISSRSDSLGNDTDQAYHFGLGVKAAMSRRSVIRLDVRDNISNKRSGESFPHNLEVLLGVSFVFGAKEPPPPPTDMDGDGFMDNEDDCPDEAGIAPDGCPPEDTDGDGITDDADACPEEAGIAPDGCPDKDSDKDGIPVPDDKCPEEAGIAPDGCPDKDSDKDGIPVPDDRCPDQPETVNGYQDADGCPDTVPEKIQKFDGVLEGIEFASGKSTIRNASKPKLDEAAAVMVEFPSVKILIIGHTDDQGKAADNKKLSEERARAVRDYLASKGVDAGRIAVRGEGEDKPRDTNKTAAGRARNRRIEFQILKR